VNLAVWTSPRFAEHLPPPGHPERPERAEVMDVVAAAWRDRGATLRTPVEAEAAALARVHAPGYLDELAATDGRPVMFDADTYGSPASWSIARLAAGAALEAAIAVMDGPITRTAALVRPPGHHAMPDRAMGFCLINNAAVAAAGLLARGVPRVAIVDIDVHHGNGTQAMFEADPRVLFLSVHQWPCYPGTGSAEEVGRGEGTGFTVNLPLPPGCGNEDYDLAFREVAVPVLEAFDPAVLLVSAGFDAHGEDPLARMRLTTAGYAALMGHLVRVAHRCAGGRLTLVTEGGYDLPALAACLEASLAVMAGHAPPLVDPEPPASHAEVSSRARAAVAEARRIQSAFWRGL
jgi:acetoin utilization deacetylase AcuC-like enzyme